MFLNLGILTKFYVLYHNSEKTGCITEPAAPDGFVGSSSVFCACMSYIRTVCLHKCLEISPTVSSFVGEDFGSHLSESTPGFGTRIRFTLLAMSSGRAFFFPVGFCPDLMVPSICKIGLTTYHMISIKHSRANSVNCSVACAA